MGLPPKVFEAGTGFDGARLEEVHKRLEQCGGGWPIRLLRKLHHYGLVGQEQPPVWALELIVAEIEAELDKPVR